MDIKKRLLRRPLTAALWLVLVAVMAAFLTVSAALRYSTVRLTRMLDESHTAVAVRSDHEVISYADETGGHYLLEDAGRTFPAEERAWLEGLESVRAVRIHSLCGGWSPDFEAALGLRRESSWREQGNAGSYRLAILTGTVEKLDIWGGGTFFNDHCSLQLLVRVDEIVSLHPEYRQILEKSDPSLPSYITIAADIYAEAEDAEIQPYFEEGQRYVFFGTYWPEIYDFGTGVPTPRMMLAYDYPGSIVRSGALRGAEMDWDESGVARVRPVKEDSPLSVFAEPAEGTWADLTARSPRGSLWQATYELVERQLHSLPVLGTENLESLYQFVTNEAAIVEGRSFTPEEYESGAHVMVISQETARKHSLSVGDTLELRQYLLQMNDSMDTESISGLLTNPVIGALDTEAQLTEPETYTIVGIYSMVSLWPEGSYAFCADTVFIPQKAQIAGAFGPDSEEIFGTYLSVELVNGHVEEFRRAVANSPYVGEFYTVDQGYEEVQKSLNGLEDSARQLLFIAGAAWCAFLLLYLLMYQNGQRSNAGIMRSVGASRRETQRYLFCSGALVAAAGVIVGTAAGGIALHAIQKAIYSDALSRVDHSVFSAGKVITDEALWEMVRSSGLSVPVLAALALAQLAIFAAVLWLHARYTAGQRPRKLMGV